MSSENNVNETNQASLKHTIDEQVGRDGFRAKIADFVVLYGLPAFQLNRKMQSIPLILRGSGSPSALYCRRKINDALIAHSLLRWRGFILLSLQCKRNQNLLLTEEGAVGAALTIAHGRVEISSARASMSLL